jgi:hypothetical protein
MSDPGEVAADVMERAENLLVEVYRARILLAAGPESPERTVYLAIIESFERGLLVMFEGVVAELRGTQGDL